METRFVGLVQVLGTQSAYAITNHIISLFEKLSIDRGLTDTLAAINSDSASTNLGITNSVWQKLQTLRGKPVQAYGCSNHHLHLSIGESLKRFSEIKAIESLMDDIRRFIHTGQKRTSVWVQISAAMGVTNAHNIQTLAPIKWITSEFEIMSRFLASYTRVYQTLEKISTSFDDFDQEVTDQAQLLLNRLRQRNNLVWMAALVDILTPLSELNLRLQSGTFTIVDATLMVENCLKKLERLKSVDSLSELANLNLLRLSLLTIDTRRVPEAHDFFSINELDYYGFDPKNLNDENYTPTHTGTPVRVSQAAGSSNGFSRQRFQEIVDDMINKITIRMASKENIRHLKIFRNDLLPDDPLNIGQHFDANVESLPAFAHHFPDIQTFRTQYIALITEIIADSEFSSHRYTDAVQFWTYWINRKPQSLTLELTDTILSVLSVPVSNSICERALSILSNAQKKCKNTPLESLRQAMNIKLNGPPLDEFDAIKMAKEWGDKGHWLSDCKLRAKSDPKRPAEEATRDACPNYPDPHYQEPNPDGIWMDGEFHYGAVGGCDIIDPDAWDELDNDNPEQENDDAE